MPPMTVDDLEQEANDTANDLWRDPSVPSNIDRGDLQRRFATARISLPSQRPSNATEWSDYYQDYARLVRNEAAQKFADRLNPSSATGAPPSDADLEQAADRWRIGVRAHDKWNPDQHLFPDKPRGHGQAAGSTDGRLLRKLMMAATQRAVDYNIYTSSQIGDPDTVKKLDNLSTHLKESSVPAVLRKAIFLTKEKLRNPLEYKQKYARVVPFDDPDDSTNPAKWVKASHRFYTPTDMELPLPPRTGGKKKKRNVIPVPVTFDKPPDAFPNFGGVSKKLIEDVGQKSLGDCGLLSSAASLPRNTLMNMFSWRPSSVRNGSEGVTTRLHDEQKNPIYIRTQKNQLWNDASDHKALWPAALDSAAAKIGRKKVRDFRKGEKPRDPVTGMPIYNIRWMKGLSGEEASEVLTGKGSIVRAKVSGLSAKKKKRLLLKAWTEARNRGAENGVATFGNFKERKGRDKGSGHATVWLGSDPLDNRIGKFGNPWVPGGKTSGVGGGYKMFPAPLSRVRKGNFLDPSGADPANDRFVPAPSSASLSPEAYQVHRRSRIGNLMI